MTRDRVPLYIAVGSAALAGGLVALVAIGHLAREILEVRMIIAGAFFVAGLSAISRFLDQNQRVRVDSKFGPALDASQKAHEKQLKVS